MNKENRNRSIIERISINAMIASIYFILTMATLPVSFMGMQIRIAEMLILLCFFRKDFVIGISVGTLLTNTMSPMFAWDMLFGTLATLISGLLIGYMKQLFVAAIIPVVINAFVVGLELHLIMGLPFWLNVGLVGLGEFIAVAILGYLILLFLGKNEKFQEMIGANQNYRFKW